MSRSVAPSPDGVRAVTASRRPSPRRRQSSFERSRRRLFAPFVLPALVVYVAIMIVPTIFSIWLSMNRWAGAGPMEWVGWSNYSGMFKDPVFRTAALNTVWIVVGVGVVVFALSFGLTMILQQCWGRKTVRLVIFFPSLVPAIVISILWGFLFDYDGLLNRALGAMGVDDPPKWLAQDNLLWVILLGMVWVSAGTYTVIFMAAADRIPRELYDAAELDGANAWQTFRSVTLPMMGDVVSVCSVLWCVSALKTFEFILTFSGTSASLPPTQVWNFAMYSYADAFSPSSSAQYGSAAAAGVVTMVLTLALAILARRVTKRDRLSY